ncbi:DNA circularization protein [Rhodoferax aquaticus]|uniref:Multidrug DMT transporter n=1 Tax=Rhodoferax aquaticus TaxID=2527691 RepID=A0A515ETI4_9BURK|nr:DNA circularization N-terminal domain-containing protein [Rhodoferax aquaticus]QDL55938.1 multidrug DMT transporter [Rhodoferax aquaticus]
MPIWIDQLLRAKFRDVYFQVDSIEHQAGYNLVVREYPFQDLPTVFRMGQGAEEIKFSAYVIGDDYMEQRDALRAALDAPGSGDLVHPTAGTMSVFVSAKYSIKENPTAEGGMARFDLTFVRGEVRRYPRGVANTQATAKEKSLAAQIASMDAFFAAYDLSNKPGWAADRSVARVTDSVSAIWANMSKVTSGLGDFTNTAIGNYQAVRDGISTLVRQPRQLAKAISNLFALPTDLSSAAARDFAASFEGLFDMGKKVARKDFEVSVMPAVGAGLVMYGTGSSTGLGLDTPARRQLAVLNDTSDQLVESLALAGWVQAIAAADMTSYDDALALRGKVNDQATRLLLRASTQAASDTLPTSSWHDATMAMLSASLADIRDRSRDLARLTTYTPDGWMPVWLVSYKLFGTVAYADEILDMNPHITHPLLVPPGKPLRVMRHD